MPNTTITFEYKCDIPHLGLASLASNIDRELIDDIKISDLNTVKRNLRKYIKNLVSKFNPDIVGLSAMSFQYETAASIARLIKRIEPETCIVLGGYHVTLAFTEISSSRDSRYFDFFVRGEGETAFNQLIRKLTFRKSIMFLIKEDPFFITIHKLNALSWMI